jgi:hypothetical protein
VVNQVLSESSSSESSSSEGGSEEGGSDGGDSGESDEENSDGKGKDEKKKVGPVNPMLVASDLTTAQGPDLKYSAVASFGISQSSLAGNESWGANAMIWSTLRPICVGRRIYQNGISNNGKLKSNPLLLIHSELI